MVITAIAVGLLTAYYFGVRRGTYAAAASGAALLAALVIPDLRWQLYAVVAVYTVAVVVLGPRFGRPMGQMKALALTRRAVVWTQQQIRKFRP